VQVVRRLSQFLNKEKQDIMGVCGLLCCWCELSVLTDPGLAAALRSSRDWMLDAARSHRIQQGAFADVVRAVASSGNAPLQLVCCCSACCWLTAAWFLVLALPADGRSRNVPNNGRNGHFGVSFAYAVGLKIAFPFFGRPAMQFSFISTSCGLQRLVTQSCLPARLLSA
jgi:hypothetical protein